jgi:hypothetical protein
MIAPLRLLALVVSLNLFSTGIAQSERAETQFAEYDFDRTLAQPELKVALLGDTGARKGFGAVLDLIKAEGAKVVMINGDFGYDASAAQWKAKLKSSIDTKQFAIIGSLGNHDTGEKPEYIAAYAEFRDDHPALKARCSGKSQIAQGSDIILLDEICTFGNVSIIVSGIGQVFTKPYFEERLERKLVALPSANWRLAGYHFTLKSMNPGLKPDENSHKFFDLLRRAGAIGAQAHTHVAMASCPINTPFVSGTTPKCHPNFGRDLEARFVAPGTGMFIDSSLGGVVTRPRLRCSNPASADCIHMVDLIAKDGYTRTDGARVAGINGMGAMFITFNHGGDPSRARVEYKTIERKTIFSFNIRR